MSEADYYAPGSYNDPNAPWNEVVIPERDFDVTCSQTLSKTVAVTTNHYNPEFDEEDGHTYANTSDTDWANEYHDNDHYTPLELINKFKEYLMKQWDTLKDAEEANDTKTKYKKREIQHLIEECSNWTEDETEFIEE